MRKTLLSFQSVPQLAKTDVAYAIGDHLLRPFYAHEPRLENFPRIIADKALEPVPRADLVAVLKEQYSRFPENTFVKHQIEHLASDKTFTVVTAHQPSLLLGPLYYIYKTISTINLAESIQGFVGPGHYIVPVFVLGSEDHDIDELNHINLFNKQLKWAPEASGPVGAMPTASLAPLLGELKSILGDSENANYILEHIERAYTGHQTFAEATQALLHDLFGRYGLVVLNMSHPLLKRHFIPVMRDELTEQTAYRLVSTSIAQLSELGFKTQATPREINLFYLQTGSRERIVWQEGKYKVLNTALEFSRQEILAELDAHPERFSPNVVLRPLYQEMILPNLAYIGGGGELAYWLERKHLLEHYGVHFPALVRRNSVVWIDQESGKRLKKLGLTAVQLFSDVDAPIRRFVAENADGEISLQQEIADLHRIFDQLAVKAASTDPTLEKAVRADETRQISLLEQWEGRIIRAQKQKHEVSINQIRALKEKFFPNNGLQERVDNFLPYFLRHGIGFLDVLKENLDPLDEGFVILEQD